MTRGGRDGGLVAEAFNGGDMAGGEAVSVAMLRLLSPPPLVSRQFYRVCRRRAASEELNKARAISDVDWLFDSVRGGGNVARFEVGANKVDDREEESRVY